MKPSRPAAYPETYLDDAMRTLGEAVEWAASAYGMPPSRFLAAFVASGAADAFGAGVPKFVAGLSGPELVREVLDRCGIQEEARKKPLHGDGATPEFWAGWILAWYQWRTALPFRAILRFLPADELVALYTALHEAPEERCWEAFEKRRHDRQGMTALAAARKAAGFTQTQLSVQSGIALRSIQQWEGRSRKLANAAANSVAAIARVLGTTSEALLAE